MKLSDINISTVKSVINELDSEFHTRDVSENIQMEQSHPRIYNKGAYHSVVGRVLGRNSAYLNIKYIDEGNNRGAIWRKNLSF